MERLAALLVCLSLAASASSQVAPPALQLAQGGAKVHGRDLRTLKPRPKGWRAPPDRVAPYPPAPPMLLDVHVGPVSSIDDVCRICTERAYDAGCYSEYTSKCLTAMRLYIKNVLGVADTFCSCYTAVFSQLQLMCPKVDRRVQWSSNCDRYCYYGPPCPANPVLYAIAKPGYQDLAERITGGRNGYRSTPARSGTVAVVVDVRLDLKRQNLTCYTLMADSMLPRPIKQAAIRYGQFGHTGPAFKWLFRQNRDPNMGFRSRCSATPGPTLMQLIKNPLNFFVSFDTVGGSVRGQLMPSVSLLARASTLDLGLPCTASKRSGVTCSAGVNLGITASTIKYSIVYSPSALKDVRAANVVRRLTKWDGSTKNKGTIKVVTMWPPVLTLFGPPTAAPPALANSMAKDLNTALTLMSGQYAINITTNSKPGGALLGRFTDSLTIESTLIGRRVVPPSRTRGSVYFRAQIGAGGICYSFRYRMLNIGRAYAYIHNATAGFTGPYIIPDALNAPNVKSQCFAVDPAITGAVLANPNSFYIQLYVGRNSPRARGQLSLAKMQYI